MLEVEVLFTVQLVLEVLLPAELIPELADHFHRDERRQTQIQPIPCDLGTHSQQERNMMTSTRRGDLVPVPWCCRGIAMCN
jgi:hypothetical protein